MTLETKVKVHVNEREYYEVHKCGYLLVKIYPILVFLISQPKHIVLRDTTWISCDSLYAWL